MAKTDLADGTKQIRPYGTFLHPNILAAYLMTLLFISLRHLNKKYIFFWLLALTGGIFFTASLAAELVTLIAFGTIVIFAGLKKMERKKSFVLFILTALLVSNVWFFVKSGNIEATDVSWQERLDQNELSQRMFIANPLESFASRSIRG